MNLDMGIGGSGHNSRDLGPECQDPKSNVGVPVSKHEFWVQVLIPSYIFVKHFPIFQKENRFLELKYRFSVGPFSRANKIPEKREKLFSRNHFSRNKRCLCFQILIPPSYINLCRVVKGIVTGGILSLSICGCWWDGPKKKEFTMASDIQNAIPNATVTKGAFGLSVQNSGVDKIPVSRETEKRSQRVSMSPSESSCLSSHIRNQQKQYASITSHVQWRGVAIVGGGISPVLVCRAAIGKQVLCVGCAQMTSERSPDSSCLLVCVCNVSPEISASCLTTHDSSRFIVFAMYFRLRRALCRRPHGAPGGSGDRPNKARAASQPASTVQTTGEPRYRPSFVETPWPKECRALARDEIISGADFWNEFRYLGTRDTF